MAIEEIKGWRFTCDACRTVILVSAPSRPSIPEGWHQAEFRGYTGSSRASFARDMDLCVACRTKEGI